VANIFLVSDTHFGHEATCTKFLKNDGTPLRPFANAEEMNEEMVKRWNAVVKHNDKVYHLGDAVINKKFLDIFDRLNGTKRLVRGNHDIFDTKEYMQYFKEVYGVRVLDGMILSHIPLHPASITERYKTNVHGHYHANLVTVQNPYAKSEQVLDPRYLNVSVEQTDFTPISLEDAKKRIRQNEENCPFWSEIAPKKRERSAT